MKFQRCFTTTDRPVADQIDWKTVPAQVDRKTASLANVEVPAHWSQNAANIFADMYLRKAGVPSKTYMNTDNSAGLPIWLVPQRPVADTTFGAETSAKQVFARLAGAWTYHGWVEGYFKAFGADADKATTTRGSQSEEYARAFYDEVYWCLAMQLAAPNSPQWFNTGLHWAYGIAGADTGMWRVDPNKARVDPAAGTIRPVAERVLNSYEYPQPHACFLTPTADDLVGEGGIMDTWVREARIFKHGSGSGTNISGWRAKGEKLSGGGTASGAMSWLSIGDAAAGAIQSGGTTRRAAVMRIMDVDHPEIEDFVEWKVREEGKAAAMYVGSQLLRLYHQDIEKGIDRGRFVDVPQPMIDRLENGFEPQLLRAGYEEEAIGSVDGQNSNNSIRPTDRFMELSSRDPSTLNWDLTARTTGEVMKTINASELWDKVCRAAWACADPGIQFADAISSWHTCPNDGEIVSCNPCSEYQFLPDTACNLVSLRLSGFLREDGTIDLDVYEHVVRLFTIILDISISMASFPSAGFARGAFNYRTLGLGFMDLGGLLMRLALPYDSDEGRALAAGLTALMTGVAYRTSAEMAEELGPFPRWDANAEPMAAVMRKHREAVPKVYTAGYGLAEEIVARSMDIWEVVAQGPAGISFRNAQVTLQAPTGTIHLVTDCDTSGIEPDYALVKRKTLAGGGSMLIVNQAVPSALRKLKYPEQAIDDIIYRLQNHGELEAPLRPMLSVQDRAVFACVAELDPMAHVKMVAVIQPFLSGAASKTVNLPNDATVEDVSRIYREAWRLGIKAIALYRDGSKLTQPLKAAAPKAKVGATGSESFLKDHDRRYAVVEPSTPLGLGVPPSPVLARGQRELPPHRHRSETQKVRVGGQTAHYTLGYYDDGRLCELFVNMANAGSTLNGFAGCLAKMTSIALQYGAPPEKVFDALHGVKFEPAGVVELHGDVRMADSIPDLIARDVMINHLGRDDLSNRLRMVAVDTGDAVVALDREAVAIARSTGETCGKCGGIVVQDGSCKTCTSCGDRLGGCG